MFSKYVKNLLPYRFYLTTLGVIQILLVVFECRDKDLSLRTGSLLERASGVQSRVSVTSRERSGDEGVQGGACRHSIDAAVNQSINPSFVRAG